MSGVKCSPPRSREERNNHVGDSESTESFFLSKAEIVCFVSELPERNVPG